MSFDIVLLLLLLAAARRVPTCENTNKKLTLGCDPQANALGVDEEVVWWREAEKGVKGAGEGKKEEERKKKVGISSEIRLG